MTILTAIWQPATLFPTMPEQVTWDSCAELRQSIQTVIRMMPST